MADDLEENWPFGDYVSIKGALNMMSRRPINPGIPKSDIGMHFLNCVYEAG